MKSHGTCWIEQCICAMECIINKFGLYTRHLKEAADETKDLKGEAVIRGKLKNAQVLVTGDRWPAVKCPIYWTY